MKTTAKEHWYNRNVKMWQAVIFSLILMAITGLTTWAVMSETENYQYENIQAQKELVDKSIEPIKNDLSKFRLRIEESETKIQIHLADSERVNRKLESTLFDIDPQLLREHLNRDRRSITQNANPTVTVSPVINTGKHHDKKELK